VEKKIDQMISKRLLLRPIEPMDSEDLYLPMSDPETMQYWNEPPQESIETTKHWIEKLATDPRHCFWAICFQGKDTVIGFIGFLRKLRVANFMYLLRSDYWHQGLMTEAAHSVLAYGFEDLKLDRTEAWVHEGNKASKALLHKLGFTFVGRMTQQYRHFPEPVEMLVHGLRPRENMPKDIRPMKFPEFQSLEPVLPVNNVQEAVDYYCQHLGFHLDYLWGDPPMHGAVSYGEWSTQTIRIQFRGGQPHRQEETRGEIFIMVEPEIEILYHRCQSQGVTIKQNLTLQPWGMQEFAIQDGNGYIIRFGKPEKVGFI